MDAQSQMTRPYYGHDQAEDPIRIHHPEEVEHHEKGASKVLKKVKEKAKKIKNTLTKQGHGHEHGHDVDEEEYDYDEGEPEVHGAPVYESFAMRGGVTGKPESLSHAGETNIPAPEEIIPPGTKVFPVVSSDYTKPIEPVSLHDTSYGDDAPSYDSYHVRTTYDSYPVRATDIVDQEERRDVPTRQPFKVSDLSDREETREAHYESLEAPVSLFSATEDVTRTFAHSDKDEYLDGQHKVYVERPKRFEEDPAGPGGSDNLSGESNYQCKVTDPTQKSGSGVAGIPEIAESLGRMEVTDESSDQNSGFERDMTKSHDFGLKNESGIRKDSPTRFGRESGAELGGDFPTRGHELGLKTESGIGKDSLTYPSESGTRLQENFPTRSDDVRVETELGRNLQTGTQDQFSLELSRPKQRDYSEEMRDETTQKTKPNTYTEQIVSATSAITNKAIAAKDVVASKLGYSGERSGESHVVDETLRSATGYEHKVAGTVAEKLTQVYDKVKETGSNAMRKLPLSGGGNVAETQQGQNKTVSAGDYLSEKLKPGEEDKALSELITEELHLGREKKKTTTKEMEVTVEKIPTDEILGENEDVLGKEVNEKEQAGMVGRMKGTVTSWLGSTKEVVKAKSQVSGEEESSQSLGSTVGTMGFKDTGGGSKTVQVQRGLGK